MLRRNLIGLLAASSLGGCFTATTAGSGEDLVATGSVSGGKLVWPIEAKIVFSEPVQVDASRALDLFTDSKGFVGNEITAFLEFGLSIVGDYLACQIPSPQLTVPKREGRDGYSAEIEFVTAAVTVDGSKLPAGRGGLPTLISAGGDGDYRWTVNVKGRITFSNLRPDTLAFNAEADINIEAKTADGWGEPKLKWDGVRDGQKKLRDAIFAKYPLWLEHRYRTTVKVSTT